MIRTIFTNNDVFSKTYTLLLTFFFMGMLIAEFITQRTINLEAVLGFIVPIFTHTSHAIAMAYNNRTAVSAATSSASMKQVAEAKQVLTGGSS